MSKKRKSGWWILILFVIAGVAGYFIYRNVFGEIKLNRNYTFIYVETKDDFEDVMKKFRSEKIIDDMKTFRWLAKQMDLEKNLHPGKYRILNGMTARQIINVLKYHKEEKIKLTLNSQIRHTDDFVNYVANKLELSANELEDYLSDEKKLADNFGLDPDNAFGLVVPGIYEVGWGISTNELFDVFKKKYKEIWHAERIKKAMKTGYTVPEIIVLASIVQNESGIASEQEKIAGVYINRLKKGMLLQADPTLKFANKKYDAKRVYDVDKLINSPYNTYKFKGLPPGPISLVGKQAIDAVLNYSRHNYLFFCAKCSLNGYSDFSTTYAQHQKFAAAYQKAMDKKCIK
jgi:UPF0755 protein